MKLILGRIPIMFVGAFFASRSRARPVGALGIFACPTLERFPLFLPYKGWANDVRVPLVWLLWVPKMCRHALQRPRHALQCLRSPTSKKNPSTLSLVVHYSLNFTTYKAASGGRGVLFDVGLLGCCKACRGWPMTL